MISCHIPQDVALYLGTLCVGTFVIKGSIERATGYWRKLEFGGIFNSINSSRATVVDVKGEQRSKNAQNWLSRVQAIRHPIPYYVDITFSWHYYYAHAEYEACRWYDTAGLFKQETGHDQ